MHSIEGFECTERLECTKSFDLHSAVGVLSALRDMSALRGLIELIISAITVCTTSHRTQQNADQSW